MNNCNLLKIKYPNYIKDWDENKNKGLDKNKITVGSSRILIDWKCNKCGYEWRQKVDRRILHKTECKVCLGKDRLLMFTHPHLFLELDKKKNKDINIKLLTNKTSKKIWWICKNDHSWYQNIDTRVKLGSTCRGCMTFKESIAITHHELLKEWDYVKNPDLDPNFLTKGSNKSVWWKCEEGHSYKTQIYHRTKGSGCIKCKTYKNRLPFLEEYPSLETEWDYEKNKGINQKKISSGSNKKVWWRCKKNHSYECDIWSKTNRNSSCPYCKGLKIDTSNSLLGLRPDLCKQWDFESNIGLSPTEIPVSSNKKVWWKCEKGHSWESLVYNRTKKNGTACPMCSGRTSSNNTSLIFLFPDLMNEWDYEKNVEIDPENLRPGSHKKVGWVCKLNPIHKWETPIYSRTSKGNYGCPYCSGKFTQKEDSIGFINPPYMKEWDWKKNKEFDAFSLSPKSEKKVWWFCLNDKKHFWKTNISSRTTGTGCPYCSFTKIIVRRYIDKFKVIETDKISLYYLIFYNINEAFYKIGITKNTIEDRYKDLFEKTGYKIIKVRVIKKTLQEIVNMEQTIHIKVSRNLDTKLIKYKPKNYFGGISECYEIPSGLKVYDISLKNNYEKNQNIISIYKL
jgi:hypothetical protein